MAVSPEDLAAAVGVCRFRVGFAAADLAELRRRIQTTRWPEPETVNDDTQGVPLATMQALADYWATDDDLGRVQATLNTLASTRPRSTSTSSTCGPPPGRPAVDRHPRLAGLDHRAAQAHRPLTDPTTHGGGPADAFDLVIPSLPGHGFSAKPTTTGWDPTRTARAWTTRMDRLGYDRYVAQGGDWAPPSPRPWPSRPPRAGRHPLHMAGTAPQELVKGFATGDPPPSGLSAEEHTAYEQLRGFSAKHPAYAQIMSTRPQTLYGLADSPVDLAAFLLDHGDGTGPPLPPPRPRRPLRRLGTTPTPHPRTPNRLPTTPLTQAQDCGSCAHRPP